MLNEEESFIGVADFEQEVVKGSHIEETLFDDDIMHSLLQGINEQAQLRVKDQSLQQLTHDNKND
jgi:hypothetical protein